MQISPEAKVGLTVVLSLVLLVTMTMAIGRIDFGQNDAFELDITYRTVDGLREGAPVRFAGVNVGKVSIIELLPYGVLVRIKLDRELLIPVDSRFVIANAGILGDKYVEIVPGRQQQALTSRTEVVGVEPIAIDHLLGEVESALKNLNFVVNSISEFADSEELRVSMADTGVLLRDTVAGLKATVDQVSDITVSVKEVATHVEDFSKQLPDIQIQTMFNDLEVFSRNIAGLDIAKINDITTNLSTIPFYDLARDIQRITQELASMNFADLEKDLQLFTNNLAALDLTPLVGELTKVTNEIASLGISERADEIARFTAQLDQLPLLEIADDLRVVTNSIKHLPLTDIAANIQVISSDLASVQISDIVSDLKVVTKELSGFGWQDMAIQVNTFTERLSTLDIDQMIASVSKDLKQFSNKLTAMELDHLFNQLSDATDNIVQLTAAVDISTVQKIVEDFHAVSSNARLASIEVGELAVDFKQDLSQLSQDSFIVFGKIQEIATSVQYTVDNINAFVDDMFDDGTTASSLKFTLANIQESTDELTNVLRNITGDLPLNATTLDELKSTMTSIQKINSDIQNLKGMGEKINVESSWGVYYDIKGTQALSPDIQFQFSPEDYDTFYVIGWNDIGSNNLLQLQYGKETGKIRQRYGLIDTTLGVGIDGRITDKWGLTAELSRITKEPTLSLKANYQWWPDWWFGVKVDNIFNQEGINFGIERKF